MSSVSRYRLSSQVMLTPGILAQGIYAVMQLDLRDSGVHWTVFEHNELPRTRSYEAALDNLQRFATARKLPRSDCPIYCWHLRRGHSWCDFFQAQIDLRLGQIPG